MIPWRGEGFEGRDSHTHRQQIQMLLHMPYANGANCLGPLTHQERHTANISNLFPASSL